LNVKSKDATPSRSLELVRL